MICLLFMLSPADHLSHIQSHVVNSYSQYALIIQNISSDKVFLEEKHTS